MSVDELIRKYLAGERDFREANLENANLENANLEDADMWGANLENANLENANLKYADMWGANLERANLERANLRGANLKYANLRGANLRGANLRGANLRGANLEDATLFGANLEDANLFGANLENANLEDANLVGVFGVYSAGGVHTSSRHDVLLGAVTIDNGALALVLRAGCQKCSADELRAKVAKTHGDNIHARQYALAISFIEGCFEIDMAAGKWDYLLTWDEDHKGAK